MTNRVRAAIYHRVSTTDQAPGAARAELRAAAERQGMTVALELEETGSGANNSRPGLVRLMQAARRGSIDAVLVWKLDRFGRSALDLLSNLRELEASGVRFLCVTQGIDIRPGGDPMSRLLLTMLGAVAEFELDLIRERTRLGMQRARREGKQLGRPRGELPALAKVQRLRARGASWAKVAEQLDCTVWGARQVLAEKGGRKTARVPVGERGR